MYLNVIGVPRSGHTVIRNWLVWQYNEDLSLSTHKHNDGYSVEFSKNFLCITPYYEYMTPDTFLQQKLQEYKNKHIILDTQAFDLAKTDGRNNVPSSLPYKFKTIVVLRDIYNLCSSIIERDKYTPHIFERNIRDTIPIWLSHAKYCLQNKSHLLFNRWLVSKWYRQYKMWQLGIYKKEKQYNKIPHNGSGSSFKNMAVLNRYKEYIDHYCIRDNVTSEIQQINQKLFGDIYGK